MAGGDAAGGDLNKAQAGGDLAGGIATSGGSIGVTMAPPGHLRTEADLKAALNQLAEEVCTSNLPVRDRTRCAEALLSLADQVESATPDRKAVSESISTISRIGAWAAERVSKLAEGVGGKLVDHWLIPLLLHTAAGQGRS